MKRRLKLSSFLFGTIIARAYDEGGRSIWLPGRSQTFINISLPPCVYVKPVRKSNLHLHWIGATIVKFQGAANFKELQISRSCKFWGSCESCACTCKFCGLSNFKSSYDFMRGSCIRKKQRSCDCAQNLTAVKIWLRALSLYTNHK